jgi:hypothetical protein
MNIPIIPGTTPVVPRLIQDLTNVVYSNTYGQTKYMLSMVAKDWNIYCISKMKIIENNEESIEQNCKECNVLEIVRNYKKLFEEYVMKHTCKYNIILLLKIIIRLKNKRNNSGLYGACLGGHINIVKYMIRRGANDYIYALFCACYGGYMDIIQYLIKRGANSYNDGLEGACIGGHMDIAKYMIELGAKNYDCGLAGACRGVHMDIVKYMVECGANYYNGGLFYACRYKHIDIIKYLIECGATSCLCVKSINEHLHS